MTSFDSRTGNYSVWNGSNENLNLFGSPVLITSAEEGSQISIRDNTGAGDKTLLSFQILQLPVLESKLVHSYRD